MDAKSMGKGEMERKLGVKAVAGNEFHSHFCEIPLRFCSIKFSMIHPFRRITFRRISLGANNSHLRFLQFFSSSLLSFQKLFFFLDNFLF